VLFLICSFVVMCMTFYLIKCIFEFIFMQFYTYNILGTEWLIFIY